MMNEERPSAVFPIIIHPFSFILSKAEATMISYKIVAPALGLVLLGSGAPVWGQGQGITGNPGNRPAVSPYINLLRAGSSAGVNYYGLVKPDIEFRSGIQRNQQQISANQQSVTEFTAGMSTTGHPTRYMTHWSYFMNNGVGAAQPGFRRPAPAVLVPPPRAPAARR
jgi:hypothetical protein